MNSERWQRIDAIFKEAIAQEPQSRATFLTDACQGDTTLHDEVDQLLTAFNAAGSFLETPVAESLGLDDKPKRTPALNAGQQLAHYQIVSELGAGGMGEVYLANDVKLDRPVAIKILPTQFTQNLAQVRRFEREARAASALNNPNIITIHEVGKEDDLYFIATEFIEGQTLRQKLANGDLPAKVLIDIAEQIARALAAAHAAGIIHRDIKPENVMVRPDGLVKVLDFGLAKASDLVTASATKPSALSHETDGMMMGTVSYLSPEQVRRQKVDHRTDIFSLGVVLYEMLAGARPFAGESVGEVFDRILGSEPKPINSSRSSAGLNGIIERALAKDPARRYGSAEEMRADLAGVAQALGTPRPSRWPKVAALLAGLTLVAALGAWLWQTRRELPAPRLVFASAAQKLTDLPQEEMYPTLTPDGQTLVFASSQSGTWDIYRQTVGERAGVNLTNSADSADTQPALSPDGLRIAFRSFGRRGGVFVMNIDGSNLTQVTDSGFNPAWSPDGNELALNDDNMFDYESRNTYPSASRLWAVNLASGQQRVITTRDAVQSNWSPHGQRLAFWGEQKGGHRDIWTVASDGNSEPVAVTDDAFIDWNPIWSPDGQYLYFLSNRGGEMNLWRVAIEESTGRLRSEPEPATLPSNNCQHISFARNGKSLVYGQSTRSENVWQIGFDSSRGEVTGTAAFLTQGLKRYTWFSLAPDEQSFVYLARGEPQQDLFTADRAGTPLQRLTDDVAQDIVPRWSPDGQWIAFLSDRSGKYEIWKVRPDGSGLTQMTHEPERDIIAPVWSPDSSKLLYQVRNVNSFVIDANRPGAEQTPQALAGQSPEGFIPQGWSPDGTMLVGWQPLNEKRAIVIYTFAEQRYETFAIGFGGFPIWLNDNQRVLFREGRKLFVLDRLSGKWREVLALKPPSQIGSHALSRDNQRLYYTSGSSEADIWLLNIEQTGG
ncbi:MAG TPA: protein kinase [Pyrinomonadaceae bacterium]|nr:protein kinase [Pyrinomonadaceae bacterium]